MLSTIPAGFSSNSWVNYDPFLDFETGFTPWDGSELFSTTQSSIEPARSGSGSDESNQNTPNSNSSGSDESNQNTPNSNSSGSDESNQNTPDSNSGGLDEPNQEVSIVDDRKRRRMISNRESARRSRMRKQKHLENLRNQVNRLRVENRELNNRLRFVMYHCHSVRTDNDRLRSEYSMLRQKLSDIRQIMLFKQLQQFSSAWPCYNFATMSEQIPSLIT